MFNSYYIMVVAAILPPSVWEGMLDHRWWNSRRTTSIPVIKGQNLMDSWNIKTVLVRRKKGGSLAHSSRVCMQQLQVLAHGLSEWYPCRDFRSFSLLIVVFLSFAGSCILLDRILFPTCGPQSACISKRVWFY